jgi:hypothetical protein
VDSEGPNISFFFKTAMEYRKDGRAEIEGRCLCSTYEHRRARWLYTSDEPSIPGQLSSSLSRQATGIKRHLPRHSCATSAFRYYNPTLQSTSLKRFPSPNSPLLCPDQLGRSNMTAVLSKRPRLYPLSHLVVPWMVVDCRWYRRSFGQGEYRRGSRQQRV